MILKHGRGRAGAHPFKASHKEVSEEGPLGAMGVMRGANLGKKTFTSYVRRRKNRPHSLDSKSSSAGFADVEAVSEYVTKVHICTSVNTNNGRTRLHDDILIKLLEQFSTRTLDTISWKNNILLT